MVEAQTDDKCFCKEQWFTNQQNTSFVSDSMFYTNPLSVVRIIGAITLFLSVRRLDFLAIIL